MASKTSVEVKQELDDLLLEDTVDADPWTLARKQRAINRAIRATWPAFKLPLENSTAVTLAGSVYRYSLAALTDIQDVGNGLGICQVLLEPPVAPDTDWIPLRTVLQARDGTTWYLYMPENIVAQCAGKKLRLRYYARLAEFTLWNGSESIPVEISNAVVYAAAVDLFGIFAQGGSDYNVEDLLKLIPLYRERAAEELARNTVYCMPVWVGRRAEA